MHLFRDSLYNLFTDKTSRNAHPRNLHYPEHALISVEKKCFLYYIDNSYSLVFLELHLKR